jgi:hypothetical protein
MWRPTPFQMREVIEGYDAKKALGDHGRRPGNEVHGADPTVNNTEWGE